VDTVNRQRQRQVDSVIDEEAGASPVHEREESLNQRIEVPRREILLTKLDGFRPTDKCGFDDHLKGPIFRHGAVGHDVQAP
jgi:hypothetical protein